MRPQISRTRASTMLTTIFSLCVLSILSGHTLLRVTARSQTAQRSAAWNEALTTAAAGVDMTVADLGALLPDVRVNSQEGVALGVSQLPLNIVSSLNISSTGSNLLSGLTVSYEPTALTHGGEGSGKQQAKVMIDVLPLSTILNSIPVVVGQLTNTLSNPLSLLSGGLDLQLIRIRSRGTVPLIGNRVADADPLDTELRRPTLFWDRINRTKASQPSVSREVEVLLRPVLPFQSAITTAGRLSLTSAGSLIDSFNSTNPLASNNGQYSATRRLTHGLLISGSSDVKLGGWVFGDVKTNGATIDKDNHVTGVLGTAVNVPLPLIQPISMPSSFSQTSLPGATLNLSAGALGAPSRYKFERLNGQVHITRGLLGLGTDVEVYVVGDVTGSLTVDAGIRAKVFLGGNLKLSAGKLVNGSKVAANLQIIGMGEDGASGPRGLELEVEDISAAIYAPRHHIILTGDGDFQGAITGADLTATDAVHIHFDEALGLNVGPVLRFAVASWIEREL